jgi:hypothetical protein
LESDHCNPKRTIENTELDREKKDAVITALRKKGTVIHS